MGYINLMAEFQKIKLVTEKAQQSHITDTESENCRLF